MGITPSGLVGMPKLRKDCHDYLVMFRSIGAGRQFNRAGMQPIPITEVQGYLNLAGIWDPEEALKVLRLVQQMDVVALKHYTKQRERENNRHV